MPSIDEQLTLLVYVALSLLLILGLLEWVSVDVCVRAHARVCVCSCVRFCECVCIMNM